MLPFYGIYLVPVVRIPILEIEVFTGLCILLMSLYTSTLLPLQPPSTHTLAAAPGAAGECNWYFSIDFPSHGSHRFQILKQNLFFVELQNKGVGD
jgi:hypothetical protein